MTDPLHAFFHDRGRQGWPMPLVATRYRVRIRAGLASVEAVRSFRNAEAQSIEATLTFPVPVDAIVHGLEASVDGRRLSGIARARGAAREGYEGAIEDGRTAVLHEEVLKGIHMLSVGHVPPGKTIDVTLHFVLPLAWIGGRASLRIPLTVGQVYGRSPLNDVDDVLVEGGAGAAELEVVCEDGSVSLAGTALSGGRATVPLNAPIDLAVTAWPLRHLVGRSAHGVPLALRIEPAPSGEERLDVAVLVDRSGSMGEPVGGDRVGTKHEAVREALLQAARRLRPTDAVELWQFDDRLQSVGRAPGHEPWALGRLAQQLGQPRGGTEIGQALAGVLAGTQARDILLVTDGQSHALDVTAIARSGRRVSAVLVGSGSLEAHVGHLAALTGGQLFVAADAEVDHAVAAALEALRSTWRPTVTPTAPGEALVVERAGMRLTVRFGEAGAPMAGIADPAVAAFVAGLRLGTLDREAATELACAEGLVSHLTSLVLVDAAGEVQADMPAHRKVPLPEMDHLAMQVDSCVPYLAEHDGIFDRAMLEMPRGQAADAIDPIDAPLRRFSAASRASSRRPPLRLLDEPTTSAGYIDGSGSTSLRLPWDTAPAELVGGDLGSLDAAASTRILALAADPRVVGLATTLGLQPVVLVIALLAMVQADVNRTAGRIARKLLGDEPTPEQRQLAAELGMAGEA